MGELTGPQLGEAGLLVEHMNPLTCRIACRYELREGYERTALPCLL